MHHCKHILMKSLIFWFLTFSALYLRCVSSENLNSVLCIKSERDALLQFKADLIDGAGRLSSWSGYNKDCCKWAGVVCNNITGHVQELHLGGPNDGPYDTDAESEEASKQMFGGDLNPSLMSLKQLSYLDLSCNDFGGIPIPSFLASIQSLRYLNLSMSQFDGQIPHQLGNLTMLRVLDLRYGVWQSVFPVKNLHWLSSLNMLQRLDLSGYDLSSERDWLQVMNRFPSLLELRLSSCSLSQLPRHLNTINLTSLSILDLSFNSFDTSFMPGWIFNLTSLVSLDLTNCLLHKLVPGVVADFQKLTSLRVLHVSGNDVMNHSSVLKGIPSLRNLVSLDLSTCYLTKPILNDLRNMSSLVSLDLSNNKINETLPTSLVNLCNLRYVELQSNHLSGSISELLENLCECKTSKLESIGFWGNYLVGYLPEKLGRLQNLINFDLGFNFLTGEIPESIGTLPNLETLVLNENSISGAIPDSIGQLSALKRLDLSHNQLTGSLPNSFGNLRNLTFFSVYNNMLNGSVTTHHFTNLTSLDTLRAENNKLTLHPSVENWVPPFQLTVLRIGSWDIGPRFPSWLKFQGNLTELDISNANISDTMPDWFWTTFSGIGFLNMSHNRIQGKLTRDLGFLAPNALLDLSDNYFEGPLPASFNRPDIDFVDLSTNHLSGSLDRFLCTKVQESRLLKVLNLANNNLSGVIPDCWVNWDSLAVLNIENNRLSGGIPESVGELSSLRSLNMRRNNLAGKLPLSVMSSKSLLIVDLADNKLTGVIVTRNWRRPTSLKLLSLRSNKLEGEFPNELCRLTSIQILDLASNNISGSIPKCFHNFSIMSGKQSSSPIILYDEFVQTQVLGSASLVTKGRESSYSSILYLVTTLDLSGNRFSGHIPNELMDLEGLRYLNLSRNQLTGRIPENIGDMRLLESLDLSSNMLQGGIPSSISNLTFLNWLNVSYNSLIGRIPTSTQMQSFSASSFVGNKLCGAPLQEVCGKDTHVDKTKGEVNSDDDENEVDWVLIISLVIGFFVGFWLVVGPLAVRKAWRITYFRILDKVWETCHAKC
ncbi:Leucine-rich repeat-containing protein [Artemisia annua]|uniref:Leucine-rich repeat-containing protein n=1 Tax=Artemisia annua TaxID=35608 RepID=A0A2U1NEN0_ARTAN|nr:Leucine-rich repeat-containing protein [Artemisia annua]